MYTKQWAPIQIAFLLAFGSAQAVADSGWYYDEDRDTIVFTAEGSRSNYIRTNPSINETVAQTGRWYHDEDRDTIVFTAEGSRSNYARTNPTINETMAQTGPWYHDEDSDTIVINVEGSRSNYTRTNPSIEAPELDFNQAHLGH